MDGRPDRHGGRAGDLTAPEPLTAPEARIGTERHHEALTLAADPTRFADGTSLGVDEHIWHHVGTRPIAAGGCGPKALTGMVDPTPDQQGRVLARLLDLVPGRSGQAYTDWLGERGARFRPGVMWKADRTATASFQLGSGAVDECRRRVQQDPRAPRSQGRRSTGCRTFCAPALRSSPTAVSQPLKLVTDPTLVRRGSSPAGSRLSHAVDDFSDSEPTPGSTGCPGSRLLEVRGHCDEVSPATFIEK